LVAALTVGQAPFSGSPTSEKQTEPAKDQPEQAAGEKTGEKAGEKKGPPFSDGPNKSANAVKPAERTWTIKSGEFIFTVGMKPGVPDPDQVTEIMIAANAVPKRADPKFGNRVPLENANLTLEVTSPGGEVIAKFRAHQMPLSSGKYGVHFTPGQEGIYSLAIRGTTADGKALSGDLKLPVKVWPLPAELQGSGADADQSGGRKPIKM
jgi:hypothetical protein